MRSVIVMVVTMAVAIIACATARGATWYVAPGGDNGADGTTELTAWADLDRADDAVSPGDVVILLDGEYRYTWTRVLATSGVPGAWITYRAKTTHNAWVHSTGSMSTSPPTGYQDPIEVRGSYVAIEGLKVQSDSEGHGIEVNSAHHVRIVDCLAVDCGGSGVSVIYSDEVTIQGCTIRDCCRTNPFQTSGISIYHPVARDAGAFPGFEVRNNEISGCQVDVPYGSVFTDGNGIIIDDFSNLWGGTYPDDWPEAALRGQTLPHYAKGALVEGNTTYDNGGRGIHALNSDAVTVRYNTIYLNNRFDLDGTWEAALSFQSSRDARVVDNIVVAEAHAHTTHAVLLANATGQSLRVTWGRNLLYGHTNVLVTSGVTAVLEGDNLVGVDPAFVSPSVDAASADFRLRADSPAVDAGGSEPPPVDRAGVARPQGSYADLGAYELPEDGGAGDDDPADPPDGDPGDVPDAYDPYGGGAGGNGDSGISCAPWSASGFRVAGRIAFAVCVALVLVVAGRRRGAAPSSFRA